MRVLQTARAIIIIIIINNVHSVNGSTEVTSWTEEKTQFRAAAPSRATIAAWKGKARQGQGEERRGKERKGMEQKNGGFPPSERLDNFRTVAGAEKRKPVRRYVALARANNTPHREQ